LEYNTSTKVQTSTYRANAWDTDLAITAGSIGWAQKDLTVDLLEAKQELWADCDMDCQKRGSQLTTVAILLGTAYGVIALNALIMFCGVAHINCRIFSLYCTFVACLLQFAMIITSGVFLLTKYNAVCARSLTNTFDGFRWTMADDFATTFGLWISSFFVMFGFLMCGLCSAYSPTTHNKF